VTPLLPREVAVELDPLEEAASWLTVKEKL